MSDGTQGEVVAEMPMPEAVVSFLKRWLDSVGEPSWILLDEDSQKKSLEFLQSALELLPRPGESLDFTEEDARLLAPVLRFLNPHDDQQLTSLYQPLQTYLACLETVYDGVPRAQINLQTVIAVKQLFEAIRDYENLPPGLSEMTSAEETEQAKPVSFLRRLSLRLLGSSEDDE